MPNPLRPHSLSVGNKLARACWNLTWLLLFRPSPRPLHAWRRLLAKVFGARLGRGVHLYPAARIWAPWNLEMGDNSSLADDVDCYCVDKVRIGANTTVSQYSFICTASHDYGRLDMPLVAAAIAIGDSAWITSDVFIGPGVIIGDGTVVTARSSVFTDLPPWVVARGNPAAPVKSRQLRPVEGKTA